MFIYEVLIICFWRS